MGKFSESSIEKSANSYKMICLQMNVREKIQCALQQFLVIKVCAENAEVFPYFLHAFTVMI